MLAAAACCCEACEGDERSRCRCWDFGVGVGEFDGAEVEVVGDPEIEEGRRRRDGEREERVDLGVELARAFEVCDLERECVAET